MKRIANFGCGVNSVAGILKYGAEYYEERIFSDTGSEKPETYKYLKYLIEEKKWKITIINDHFGKSIYDYYYDKRIYPTINFRDCTEKFKIRPIKRHLRKKYGKKQIFVNDIFIDFSELHRMKNSDVKYQKLNYPLVYDKIDREECIEIIKKAGYKIPLKSGCYMCPFNNKAIWLNLKKDHPDLFKKILELENRGMHTIEGERKQKMRPLVNIKGKDSKDLFECACF